MKLEALEDYINLKVKGLQVWAAMSGYGSFINIEIGRKIRKATQTINDNLPEEIRMFKGEFSFNIWSPWRLESEGRIIKSWKNISEMDPDLALMKGCKIIKVKLNQNVI